MDRFKKLQQKHPEAKTLYWVSEHNGNEEIIWETTTKYKKAKQQFDDHLKKHGDKSSDLQLVKSLIIITKGNWNLLHDEIINSNPVNY